MEQEEDIDFLLLLLKRHSPEAFLAYMNINHNKSNKEIVSSLVKQWVSVNRKKLEPEPGPEKPENARLIACTLPFMLEEEVKFCYPEDDDEEMRLIGMTPPLEYYLPIRPVDRAGAFFDSFLKDDVIVGKVIEEVKDAYKICVLCFDGKKKHRYMFDLSILVYYKKADGVPVNMAVGSFVRGVLYDAEMTIRRLYVSFDPALVEHATKLGIITEDEFPLHYKMMACNRPVNRLESFLDEEVFYNPMRYENLMGAMNVDSQTIWSFYPDLRKYKCPEEEKLVHNMEKQETEFCDKWLKDAHVSYEAKDIDRTLYLLTKVVSHYPNHILGLLDRVAVYANAENFALAIADLESILKVDPTHEKALDYYNTVLCAYAQEFEKKGDYRQALKCYAKLKFMKKFEDDKEINRKFAECMILFRKEFPNVIPKKTVEASNVPAENVPVQADSREEERQASDVPSVQTQDEEEAGTFKKRTEKERNWEKSRESHRHRRRYSSGKSQKRSHKHHRHHRRERPRHEHRKRSHRESRSSPDDSRSRSPERRVSSISSDDTPPVKVRRYEVPNAKALDIINKLLSSQKNKS